MVETTHPTTHRAIVEQILAIMALYYQLEFSLLGNINTAVYQLGDKGLFRYGMEL